MNKKLSCLFPACEMIYSSPKLMSNFKLIEMRKKILIIISGFVFIAMLVMNLTMAKSDNNTILLASLQKLALANGEQDCPGGDCTFTYYFAGQM